jgi:hypothetical protein
MITDYTEYDSIALFIVASGADVQNCQIKDSFAQGMSSTTLETPHLLTTLWSGFQLSIKMLLSNPPFVSSFHFFGEFIERMYVMV